jgi:hypothetical protein
MGMYAMFFSCFGTFVLKESGNPDLIKGDVECRSDEANFVLSQILVQGHFFNCT